MAALAQQIAVTAELVERLAVLSKLAVVQAAPVLLLYKGHLLTLLRIVMHSLLPAAVVRLLLVVLLLTSPL